MSAKGKTLLKGHTLIREGWPPSTADRKLLLVWPPSTQRTTMPERADYADELMAIIEEHAVHTAWRCEHKDRWPWEPDCMCGLTKALRDAGLPLEWADRGVER